MVSFTPGLNFIAKSELDKCLCAGDPEDGTIAGVSALSYIEPSKVPLMQARKLATDTANKQHLRTWREQESRKEVLKAIDERLS
jgi:hypothetical protein